MSDLQHVSLPTGLIWCFRQVRASADYHAPLTRHRALHSYLHNALLVVYYYLNWIRYVRIGIRVVLDISSSCLSGLEGIVNSSLVSIYLPLHYVVGNYSQFLYIIPMEVIVFMWASFIRIYSPTYKRVWGLLNTFFRRRGGKATSLWFEAIPGRSTIQIKMGSDASQWKPQSQHSRVL